MLASWAQLACGLLLLRLEAAAVQLVPRLINLNSRTCSDLAEGTQYLPGCSFSVINDVEQQVSCPMLLEHEDNRDGIVGRYPKKMLNTVTFRLTEEMSAWGHGWYCASLASIHLEILTTDQTGNYSLGSLPVSFVSFLNFFNDGGYAHFNFTKNIPVATVKIKQNCHGLPRSALRKDCLEDVAFSLEIRGGSFKLKFVNDEFWSFMKRRFIDDLGGEMTHLSLTSSGLLSAVPIHFLTTLVTSDLRSRELTLARMKLGDLKGAIIKMPTLHVLRLHDDGITSLSDATLQYVPELMELDLSGNDLEKIPPTLSNTLANLNVSRNRLVAIDVQLPAALISLNVSHNNIRSLPETLPLVLETLDVSNNSLSSLPQQLPPGLRLLYASLNKLQTLPGALPATLRVLQVSRNRLQTLRSDIMTHLTELQLLDATYNLLSSIDNMWLSHHLELLNVSNNELTHISLDGPGKVSYIDASHNNIQSWKAQADFLSLVGNPQSPLGFIWIEAKDFPTEIDLGNNLLLNCDSCTSQSDVSLALRRWMVRQQDNSSSRGGPRVVRPQQPVCTDPQEQAGRPLVEVDSLEDRSGCPGSPRYIAKYVLIVISVLAIIGGVAGLCYYRRYEISYIIHLVKMRRDRLAAEKRHNCNYKYDAFVCYSSADKAWVMDHLVKKLESKGDSPEERPLRLCLHERDFPMGSLISVNIHSSMKISRSTVVVLSQAFVNSQWCRYELDLASVKVHHLVLLELERLERSRLPRHLRYLMDTRTYLEWPTQPRLEPAMWRRLRAALSQPPAEPPAADIEMC